MHRPHLRLVIRTTHSDADRSGRSLAPALAADGPVPQEIDRQLGDLGCRAQTDPNTLNALYAAFRPRLDHWIRRASQSCFRSSSDPAIEPADIEQQAFIVFADLILSWNGRGSLSAFVIAYFRWRLSDAVRRMSDSRERRSVDRLPSTLLVDGTVAAEQAIALLETIAVDLPERQGRILLLRIRDGLPWSEVAHHIGVDIRTAQRDFRQVLDQLRASLEFH
jgi:RNA polymerase sigma factor (sigma-70 family)